MPLWVESFIWYIALTSLSVITIINHGYTFLGVFKAKRIIIYALISIITFSKLPKLSINRHIISAKRKNSLLYKKRQYSCVKVVFYYIGYIDSL